MITRTYIEHLRNRALRFNLEGSALLEDFTIEQLASIYNGLGSRSMSDRVRSLLTKATPELQPSVIIHDVETTIGTFDDINGEASHTAFREANRRMRRNNLKIIQLDNSIGRMRKVYLRAVTSICYYAIKLFGWSAWVEGHTKD